MIKFSGRAIVFFVFFFAALSFSESTGQMQDVKDVDIKTHKQDIENADSLLESSKPAVTQMGQAGEFESVQTPFGYVKRRIKKVETAAPVTPEPLKPTMAVSPPAQATPEGKVSDRDAKPSEPVLQPSKTVEKSTEKNSEKTGTTIFNFDNADIYEVIDTISKILQINYVVDPNVRGKVTIRTTRGLNKQDIFPVFRQILDVNDLSIVPGGCPEQDYQHERYFAHAPGPA